MFLKVEATGAILAGSNLFIFNAFFSDRKKVSYVITLSIRLSVIQFSQEPWLLHNQKFINLFSHIYAKISPNLVLF